MSRSGYDPKKDGPLSLRAGFDPDARTTLEMREIAGEMISILSLDPVLQAEQLPIGEHLIDFLNFLSEYDVASWNDFDRAYCASVIIDFLRAERDLAVPVIHRVRGIAYFYHRYFPQFDLIQFIKKISQVNLDTIVLASNIVRMFSKELQDKDTSQFNFIQPFSEFFSDESIMLFSVLINSIRILQHNLSEVFPQIEACFHRAFFNPKVSVEPGLIKKILMQQINNILNFSFINGFPEFMRVHLASQPEAFRFFVSYFGSVHFHNLFSIDQLSSLFALFSKPRFEKARLFLNYMAYDLGKNKFTLILLENFPTELGEFIDLLDANHEFSLPEERQFGCNFFLFWMEKIKKLLIEKNQDKGSVIHDIRRAFLSIFNLMKNYSNFIAFCYYVGFKDVVQVPITVSSRIAEIDPVVFRCILFLVIKFQSDSENRGDLLQLLLFKGDFTSYYISKLISLSKSYDKTLYFFLNEMKNKINMMQELSVETLTELFRSKINSYRELLPKENPAPVFDLTKQQRFFIVPSKIPSDIQNQIDEKRARFLFKQSAS